MSDADNDVSMTVASAELVEGGAEPGPCIEQRLREHRKLPGSIRNV